MQETSILPSIQTSAHITAKTQMPFTSKMLEDLGLDQIIPAEVNGRKNGVENNPLWELGYNPCPEAYPDPSIRKGTVEKLTDWSGSTIYQGTRRNIWVYIPDSTYLTKPAQIIFFNDGAWYLSRRGPVRATQVLDSLHDKGEILPTIGIFITPGEPDHDVVGPIASYGNIEAQRSLEYDSMTPDYGRFLFTEVLPMVEAWFDLEISIDPAHRTVCGISSGGIAAFSAAWHFSDQCQRVLSHCGSFTDIWGGHHFPSLIRQTSGKPIRTFLQSGVNDANTPFGDWNLANQTMASAMQYAGYDYKFVLGEGGHSLNHGGALFADSLRWLWR